MLSALWVLGVNLWRTMANGWARLLNRRKPYVHMEISGALPEVAPPVPWWRKRFLGTTPPLTMGELRGRLRRIAATSGMPGVVLEFRNLELGWASLEELRCVLAEFQQRGRSVVAYLHQVDLKGYLAACGCTTVVMSPGGGLTLAGLRLELGYAGALLPRLGVHADVFAVSPYKAAYEALVRENPSPENARQLERILDGRMDTVVSWLAAGRKRSPQEARGWLDTGMLAAPRALQAGLVDAVVYLDQLGQQLRPEGGKVELRSWDAAAGRLRRPMARVHRKMVAVVPMYGTMVQGKSRQSPVPLPLLGRQQVGSHTVVAALRAAEHNRRVAAVVLHVDSPGGDAYAADEIWREVARLGLRKPVLAAMGNTAASGGYYVSAPCREVWARNTTLTGSIGVVALRLQVSGLLDHAHLRTHTVARGGKTGLFSALAPLTQDERENWDQTISDAYGLFVQRVADGRKLSAEKVEALAGGRLWVGAEAIKEGLVDRVGGLADAVVRARELAGLPEDPQAPVLLLTGGGGQLPDPWPNGNPAATLWEDLRTLAVPRAWMWMPWTLT